MKIYDEKTNYLNELTIKKISFEFYDSLIIKAVDVKGNKHIITITTEEFRKMNVEFVSKSMESMLNGR